MLDLLPHNRILILQPENPDGDSVASALALEEILGDAGKEVILYSFVNIPDYLRYIEGSDRISNIFPDSFDAAIIVDTVSGSLLEQTLSGFKKAALQSKPLFVLDHHPAENTLGLPHAQFYGGEGSVVATGEIVYHLAKKFNLEINKSAATHIVESMLADTLGLTTELVGASTLRVVAEMLEKGASMNAIDMRRRMFNQKPLKIIRYKGELLQRIEYYHQNSVAVIRIPWEEIQTYSPFYNPSMLVLEELRNAEEVDVSIALKTYPDGKITGKIRSQKSPIANTIAEHFGGGGHAYAAGFKTMEYSYDALRRELITFTGAVLKDKLL
jgi:phosphoesterase RecJ-like protein